MMYYYDNNYFGMHLIWWIIWAGLLIWIFAVPYDIPGQRNRKESPFDLLKKRFAAGEITNEAYQEGKKILENR